MTPVDAIWLFSEDIALACNFMAPRPPPPSHHVRVLVVPATPVRNYLKWWAIQLAIYSIVGTQIEYKQLQNCGEFHASICFPSQDMYNTSVFLNIYNCASKVAILKSSHSQYFYHLYLIGNFNILMKIQYCAWKTLELEKIRAFDKLKAIRQLFLFRFKLLNQVTM